MQKATEYLANVKEAHGPFYAAELDSSTRWWLNGGDEYAVSQMAVRWLMNQSDARREIVAYAKELLGPEKVEKARARGWPL
jgi:hypothetical protein